MMQAERQAVRVDYSAKFAKEVTQLGILKFLFILRAILRNHTDSAEIMVKPFVSFKHLFPYLEVYKE